MKAASATALNSVHLTPLKLNSILLMKHGITALREVPGLVSRVLLGLLLNLMLYLGLVAGFLYFYYTNVHTALAQFMSQHLPGWLAIFGVAAHWVVMVILGFLSLLLALRISIRLMKLWYESFVEFIIHHQRHQAPAPFAFKPMLLGLGKTLLAVGKDLVVVGCLMLLGFIPILGEILILLATCFMVGDAIVDPYRSVMANLGEIFVWPKNALPATLLLGVFPTLVLLVPILGGIFLPIGVLLQIIGFAWYQEQLHKTMVATVQGQP